MKGKVTMAALLLATTGTLYVAHQVADSVSDGINETTNALTDSIDRLVLQSEELHDLKVAEQELKVAQLALSAKSQQLDLVAHSADVFAQAAIVKAKAANQIAVERFRTSQTIERDLSLGWVWNTSMGLLYGLVGVVPTAVGGLILWRVITVKRREDEDRRLIDVAASGAFPVSREFLLSDSTAMLEMVQMKAEQEARVRLAQAEKLDLSGLTSYTHNPTTTYSPTNDKELLLMARADEQARQEEESQGASDDERASIIFEALQMQGVSASVSLKARGPQVETFAIRPGHRASKGRVKRVTVREITKHEADIAMALGVPSIRMYQGAGFVACEVARKEREFVLTTDIMASAQWRDAMSEMDLPLALGIDTLGNQVIVDLCPLPHFLIGGATNMGKSVVIQTLIYSICQQPVSKVRLTLIDPKEVEFDAYRVVPHVANVITEMGQAAQALQGALNEMDRRAQLFKSAKVQNISQYNKVADEPLAYIIIIIDELADLMATNGDEVEEVVVRLAQKARYAGIHLILATQRPDAETVTPLIRANMPARMSVRCIAAGDSKTVLGEVGAEKLLDRGDALFMSGSTPLTRLQGAYIGANEAIEAILLAHNTNDTEGNKAETRREQGRKQGRNQAGTSLPDSQTKTIDYGKADTQTRANYIKFLAHQGLSVTAIQEAVWGSRGGRRHKERQAEIKAALASLALNGNGHHS